NNQTPMSIYISSIPSMKLAVREAWSPGFSRQRAVSEMTWKESLVNRRGMPQRLKPRLHALRASPLSENSGAGYKAGGRAIFERLWKLGVWCFSGAWSLVFGVFLLGASSSFAANPQNAAQLSTWLSAQTNIQSWSADFVQRRALKSLTQPLTATG